MAGNSPLYMPGFFLVAAFTWTWSLGRPVRRLVFEWLVLASISALIAGCLASFGAARAISAFERSSGLRCIGALPGFTCAGAGAAIYTLFTWSAGIECAQLSIARRSILPMGIPVVLNIMLARIRPWTVGDFTNQWIQDVLKMKHAAILSTLAVPALSIFLLLYQLRKEGVLRRNSFS